MARKLTKDFVSKAWPGYHFDTIVKGFGLRVTENGARAYIIQYRPHPGGRRVAKRRYTIGTPDSPWTVDDARNEAKRILGLVADKRDPVAERKAERLGQSIGELCDEYLRRAAKGEILTRFGRAKRTSTLEIDRGRVDRHIKPLLGQKRVADLTQMGVERFLAAVTRGDTAGETKTKKKRGKARVRGGAGTASRVVQLLGAIMQMAVKEGIRTDNPVHGVTLPKPQRKERALIPDEYRALGMALAAAEGTAAKVTRLLALTGWRRTEVLSLKRHAVDAARQAATLEDTKTGRSIRPIGKAALDVLGGVESHASKSWYFPAASGDGHMVALRKPFAAYCKAAGLSGVTPHTLRHSFGTVADELGYADATVAAMLGHAARTQTGRYQHPVDSFLVAATDKVAAEIAARMDGDREGRVVRFPRSKARR
jgi:integrase